MLQRSSLAAGAFGISLAAAPQTARAQPEFTTTESGLMYYDVVEVTSEDAAIPVAGQIVNVHYTGWLRGFDDASSKFDSSYDRKRPLSFALSTGKVIAGWDEALQSMKVGSTRRVVIPPGLGYGKRGAGGVIPPDATLYFEMKLLSIGA